MNKIIFFFWIQKRIFVTKPENHLYKIGLFISTSSSFSICRFLHTHTHIQNYCYIIFVSNKDGLEGVRFVNKKTTLLFLLNVGFNQILYIYDIIRATDWCLGAGKEKGFATKSIHPYIIWDYQSKVFYWCLERIFEEINRKENIPTRILFVVGCKRMDGSIWREHLGSMLHNMRVKLIW